MTVLNLKLFPSDGSRNGPSEEDRHVLLYYSKGPCSDKFPKFDLWIFEDGRIIYKEVYRAGDYGVVRSILDQGDIEGLEELLKEIIFQHPEPLKTTKDLPVTTLKSNGKEFEYHDSTSEGPLRRLDVKIESLLRILMIADLNSD